jgi:hypothetical protein
MSKKYCEPLNAGLYSETAHVCKRLGKLLDALETITHNHVNGTIADDLSNFRRDIIDNLKAQGYDVSINPRTDNWKVKAPK